MSEQKKVDCDAENLAKIKAEKMHPLVWEGKDGKPVLLLVPTEWTTEQKAHASIELEHPAVFGFKLSRLALITLLRTNFSFKLGSDLLSAGWLPHEKFAMPFAGVTEDPLRRKFIEMALQKYPDLIGNMTP